MTTADRTAEFDLGTAELEAFRASHGHAFVAPDALGVGGFPLGEWAADARRRSLAGELGILDELALERVGLDRLPGAAAFAAGIERLERYRSREGHGSVPAPHVEDGFPLGEWVAARRAERDRRALPGERAAVLDRLGAVSLRDARDQRARGRRPEAERAAIRASVARAMAEQSFERGIAELRAWVERVGHARVPSRHECPSGYRLGQWCWWLRGQRRARRLSEAQAAALDELGFVWDPRGESFERGLAEWRAAGGAEPLATATGFPLRRWCQRQRDLREAGVLGAARESALDAAGFPWACDERGRLDEGLAALDELLASGSGPWVPVQYTAPDGFRLGEWLNRQRLAWRQGRLSASEAAALSARGVSPSHSRDRLVWGLVSFRRFRAAHPGRLPSSSHRDPDGFGLGSWLTVRRREARAATLDPDVAAEFAAAGVPASGNPRTLRADNEARFDAALEAYRDYRAATGRATPPRGTAMPDGRDLAVWVMNQRIDLRLGRTSPDRRAALADAGITPDAAAPEPDALFEAALAEFGRFTSQHGHDRVPAGARLPDGRDFGGIVRNWRSHLKRGSLRPDRRDALVAAGLTPARSRHAPQRARRDDGQPPRTLGAALRAYRLAHDASVLDAAIALGVSAGTVHVLEGGRHRRTALGLVGRVADLIGLDRPAAALLAGWPEDEVADVYGVPCTGDAR